MQHNQRNPLVLTKWDFEERTGSRYIPRALIRAPGATFYRIVDPDNDLAGRRKGAHQETQQNSARFKRRPARAIQDSVISFKTLFIGQSHYAQTGSHSTFAGREDRTDQQNFCMLPDAFGKQRSKFYNQGQQLGRQCQQLKTSLGKSGLQRTRSADVFSKIKNGQSRAESVNANRLR
jgi:hypothetical protein